MKKITEDSDLKICRKCHQAYPIETGFYFCQGRCRSECKICTRTRNSAYGRKKKRWLERDPDERRIYDREYYEANKEKFAQYRETFRNKHPGYFRLYQQNKCSPLKPDERYIKD